MSTNRNSLTKDDAILRSLLEHCTFDHPHLDAVPSAILPNGVASAILLLRKARFVDAVLSSNDPGVQFTRAPHKYTAHEITPLGRDWYDIARGRNTFSAPEPLEVGASVALFDAVANPLALPSNLFTGNPLNRHGESAPNEGEYLNGFIEMLRHCASQKSFQTKKEREATAIKDQLRQATGFIKRIPPEFNTVTGRWCALTHCFDGHQPTQISQREAFAFLARFQRLLDQRITEIPSIGHVWFLQYLPEIGFAFRVLLIFVTSPAYGSGAWAEPLQASWHDATNFTGHLTLGREVMGQAPLRGELIDMGEAAKLLHLKFSKTRPLCGFVDAQVTAEAKAPVGMHFRKLSMERLAQLTVPHPSFSPRAPAPTPIVPTEVIPPPESATQPAPAA